MNSNANKAGASRIGSGSPQGEIAAEDSDEDIFEATPPPPPCRTAKLTADSIYESHPIHWSSPMEAIPAGSKVADGRALVFSSGGARPASKASSIYDQETQPIDWVASPSIYDMETQPIVAADEPFISETQTFEFREGSKSLNNNEPASGKATPQSPVIALTQSDRDQTQTFQFQIQPSDDVDNSQARKKTPCKKITNSPTMLDLSQSDDDEPGETQVCQFQGHRPLVLDTSSRYDYEGDSTGSRTPPTSPRLGLAERSSHLFLDSTCRTTEGGDASLLDRTSAGEFVPETQQVRATPQRYPLLDFPSSQSESELDLDASSSPVLHCGTPPVRRNPPSGRSPVAGHDDGSCDPFAATQQLAAQRPASCDPFAPTQRLEHDRRSGSDGAAGACDPFAATQKLVLPEADSRQPPRDCDSPALSTSDEEAGGCDPFAPTQKLIVATATDEECDPRAVAQKSAACDPFAPTQKLVLPTRKPDPAPLKRKSKLPVDEESVAKSEGYDPFAATQKLVLPNQVPEASPSKRKSSFPANEEGTVLERDSVSPVLSGRAARSGDCDPFAATQKLVLLKRLSDPSTSKRESDLGIDEGSTELERDSVSPVLSGSAAKSGGSDPFAATQKLVLPTARLRSCEPTASAQENNLEADMEITAMERDSVSPVLSGSVAQKRTLSTSSHQLNLPAEEGSSAVARGCVSPVLSGNIPRACDPFAATQKLVLPSRTRKDAGSLTSSQKLNLPSDMELTAMDSASPVPSGATAQDAIVTSSQKSNLPAEMDISEMETQPFFAAIATLPALPRVECSAEMDLNEMETQPMFPVTAASGEAETQPSTSRSPVTTSESSETAPESTLTAPESTLTAPESIPDPPRVIIRRSGQPPAPQAVDPHRPRSRESTADGDSDDGETDSDFDMTFAGSQASTVTSPERRPSSGSGFHGFGRREAAASSRRVRTIRQVLVDSQTQPQPQRDAGIRFLDFGTDYVEPDPEEEAAAAAAEEEEEEEELAEEADPVVRRSNRRRLPNVRLMDVVSSRKRKPPSTITLSSGSSSGGSTKRATLATPATPPPPAKVEPPESSLRRTKRSASEAPEPAARAIKSEPVPSKKTPKTEPPASPQPPQPPPQPPPSARSGRRRLEATVVKNEPPGTSRSPAAVVKTEASASPKSVASFKTRGRRKRAEAVEASAPPPPPPPPSAGRSRRGRRVPSVGDSPPPAGAADRQPLVETDPVPLPEETLPAKRGRPSRALKTEPSVRSRSSSSSTTSTTSSSKTRRRKRALAGLVRVLFTGLDDEEEHQIVHHLGGQIVDNSKHCSVLVTNRIRRTVKFLCAVGLGVPIVGPQWLINSRTHGKFLDPWLHLLDDRDGQSKFQFQLAASLHAASETPFLSGWIFHATPNVLPPPNQMQEIVESCGGFYVDEDIEQDKSAADRKVVISCEQDRATWAAWTRKGAHLVGPEAILTGVLRQSFQPEEYRLLP